MAQGAAKSTVGAQGATGVQGPQGATGTIGPQGPQGWFIVSGQSVVNFGNTPGTNVVITNVTGQTGILSTSTVSVFMMADSTVSGTYGHNADEHQIVPIKLTAGNIAVGTGFTIYAETEWRLDSTFIVRWLWSQ